MYKPQPSRRLGFWFSAYQVLKWRGGDVVNTGWFQPTDMPPPATASSPHSPSKPPPPSLNHGKSRRLHHFWFEPKIVSEPAETTLTERKWTVTGGIPPSHTLKRLLLNMEHPQRQYPTRVAQHTRGKIYGEIIYTGHSFLGQTVLRSSTDFTQRIGWTILNQKQVTFGIIQNHKNEWFR